MPTDKLVNHPVNDNQSASAEWMNLMRELETEESTPYTVQCDLCGVALPCDLAIAGEADTWECVECYERENARERLLLRGTVI